MEGVKQSMVIFPSEMNLYEEIKKADAGDGEAMMRVGFYILFAHPHEPLEQEMADRAIEYYEKAAALGYKTAMQDLGAAYMDGVGVERDLQKSLEWYRKGWDPQDGASCMCMGSVSRYDYLTDGEEVPTTDPERIADAVYYFKLGADLNDSDCLFELGELYLTGIGVEKSVEKAFELFSKAEEYAEPDLVNDRSPLLYWRLGMCYRYGWGTVSDKDMALEYLEFAIHEWSCREKLGIDGEKYYRRQATEELQSLKKEMA
jgi:hypothetical protein